MGKEKISITLEAHSIDELDRLIEENMFQNRSQAIQEAVREKLERMESSRLARELAKLDPVFEQKLADEDLGDSLAWPEY